MPPCRCRAPGILAGGARHGGVSAATAWPSPAASFWRLMILAILIGPLDLARADQRDRLHGAPARPVLGSIPFGTDDLGQDLLARMLYGGRISLAVGLAAMVVAIVVGTIIGADRRHVARLGRHGADVADRPVPVAAGTAAAAARHLPVPRRAEGRVRARRRRLHPDRHRHRRLALDAGGAPGARPVPVAAREGVRRGRARARRLEVAPGRAPHPAQCAWAR